MKMGLEHIARNIKFFRMQNGWTQQTLADKLLISRSVIAKWENNLATPDVASLLKLAHHFQISINDLIGLQTFEHEILKDVRLKYTSDPEKFDEEVSQIIEYIMKSPSFKEQVFRLKSLPIRKQQSLITIFTALIDQYEQL